MDKFIQGPQPLVLKLPGGVVDVVEHIFPGREQAGLHPGKVGEIRRQAAGLALVPGDQQQGAAGLGLEGGGKMGLVHRRHAVDRHHLFASLDSLQQGSKFRQLI